MLYVSKSAAKVRKRKIYPLNCQMVGMESDNSNQVIQKDKSTIFVLGSDQKLLRLQETNRKNEMFECVEVFDFQEYDMRAIINNAWSHCHINTGAITFDEFVYAANSTDERQKKGERQFYWTEAKHIS